MTNPAPGWYADPQEPTRWRWWDGTAWTENVSQPSQPSTEGALWTATTLWAESRARVGSWEADVRDEAGKPAGTVRGGMEMVLADSAGAPTLRLRAERDRRGNWTSLGRVHVADGAGAAAGTLEVAQYVNGRVTLSLRRSDGTQVAVLEPEAKNDREFAIHDAAGKSFGRVVATESKRKLLSQDRTWWISLARPLPAAVDPLALGAATTLSNIQMLVVNLADHRD
jgi:acyl-coenzyme A thioesterase PaaI-like protein